MTDDHTTPNSRAERLARAYLHPPQPRLAEALEVVSGIDRATIDDALATSWEVQFSKHHTTLEWTARDAEGRVSSRTERAPKDRVRDPREAWELLAGRGVIPDDWVGTNMRRFARGQFAAAPASLAGAVTIAADPEGVMEAERLAREIAGRLVDWGVGRSPRIVWHVDEPLSWISSGNPTERFGRTELALPGGDVMHELLAVVGYSVPAAQVARRGARGVVRRSAKLCEEATTFLKLIDSPTSSHPVANLIDAHRAWLEARQSSGVVRIHKPGAIPVEDVVKTVAVADLPDPFEPLFMLIERGYVLIELTRRSIQLYARCELRSPAKRDG